MAIGFAPHRSAAKSISGTSPSGTLRSVEECGRQELSLPTADLKPHVKVSRDGTTKVPSTYFSTRIGSRRKPRRRHPSHISPEMILNARRGILSNFLEAGTIIRASDIEPMVDLQTASLNLTDDSVLKTDHLGDENEQMPQSQRKPENLFFISMQDDELPSYHFWKAETDPDPIDTHPGIDWNRTSDKPPAVQEALADPTRTIAPRKKKTGANPKPIPTVGNAWTEAGDGEFYRETNPKRDSHLRSQHVDKADSELQWRPEGTLLGIPFNSSNQRNTEDSGQFGPQPGDPDWEKVEADWERRLETLGAKEVLKGYLRRDPDKFSALRFAALSSWVRPARCDDQYARQFNEILKIAVPTLAFKLTQQTFERPVSPINFQEPLVRGKKPQGWDLHGEEAANIDKEYEVVHHDEDELEFLDFFNEKSHGELLLRRRKPIPEEHSNRRIAQRHQHLTSLEVASLEAHANQQELLRLEPGLQSAHATYSHGDDSSDEVVEVDFDGEKSEVDSSPEEVEVDSRYLVQGRLGCLEIDDISFNNFCETAQRVIACDIMLKEGEKLKGFFFIVQIFDSNEPQEYQIKNCSVEPPFFSQIFATLPRKPIVSIRVADTNQRLRIEHEKLSGHLKVTAPSIGYRYVFVRWNMRKDLESNSIEFIDNAIQFLFPQDSTSISRPETFRVEEERGLWHYDLDLQSDLFLNEGVQKSFSEITGMEEPGGQNINQADPEISIYNTTDNTQRQTTLKNRKRRRMEQAASQKQKSLVEETQLEGDEAVLQSIVEPRLRALKERQASRLHAESVYNNPGGRIGIPKYGPSLEPAIQGGPDFPTIYARVLTLAEIEDLQKQLRLCENELLQRDIPKVPTVLRDSLPKPRLRRDLIERRRNGEEYPQARNNEDEPLPLHLEDLLERTRNGEEIPQARNDEQEPLPLQVEEISEPRDLTQRRRNGVEYPQARNNEREALSLQRENISERRSRGTNQKTIQSQALDSTLKSDKQQQMVTWSSEPPSPLHSPDDPKLPQKPKNSAYYCDVCLVNITRFSLDRKKKHAQACSTTISNTLTLTSGQAAAAKKQKATGNEKGKTEPGPPESVAKAVQTDNSKDKTLSNEGLGGSDGGPHSTGRGTKRKSTVLPTHAAKKAQKQRRR